MKIQPCSIKQTEWKTYVPVRYAVILRIKDFILILLTLSKYPNSQNFVICKYFWISLVRYGNLSEILRRSSFRRFLCFRFSGKKSSNSVSEKWPFRHVLIRYVLHFNFQLYLFFTFFHIYYFSHLLFIFHILHSVILMPKSSVILLSR